MTELAGPSWLDPKLVAILLVLLAAFGEALPIVGFVVPATATILATATMASLQGWSLWPLLVVAALGAWVGDQIGYMLGWRYRQAILEARFMRRQRRHVARAKMVLQRYGLWAVAFSRFVPGLRAIVPLMAGVFRMRQLPFQAGNIGSAIVWALAHVMPGPVIAYLVEPLLDHPLFWPGVGLIVVAIVLLATRRWWWRRAPRGSAAGP